jgi:hypothetical protein
MTVLRFSLRSRFSSGSTSVSLGRGTSSGRNCEEWERQILKCKRLQDESWRGDYNRRFEPRHRLSNLLCHRRRLAEASDGGFEALLKLTSRRLPLASMLQGNRKFVVQGNLPEVVRVGALVRRCECPLEAVAGLFVVAAKQIQRAEVGEQP